MMHTELKALLHVHPRSAAEDEQLRQHLEECAECAEAHRILEFGRTVGRHGQQTRPEPDFAVMRQAFHARLDDAPSRFSAWPLWATGLAASVAVAGFFGLLPRVSEPSSPPIVSAPAPSQPDGPIESTTPVEWAPGPKRLGSVKIAVERPSTVRWAPHEIAGTRLWVDEGRLSFHPVDAKAEAPLLVNTKPAVVWSEGASFRIEALGNRVDIQVDRGAVRVVERDTKTPVSLTAGQRLSLPRPPRNAEEPPKTPTPKKRATPQPQARRTKHPPASVVPKSRPVLPSAPDEPRPPPAKKPSLPPPPKPTPPPDPLTWMDEADILRRSGDLSAAATVYAKVVRSTAPPAFKEESAFRQAEILFKQGNLSTALTVLKRASEVHSRGSLEPERTALTAQIYLKRNAPEQAASALETVTSDSLEILRLRIDVIRKLRTRNPVRAQNLFQKLAATNLPDDLREDFETLRSELDGE